MSRVGLDWYKREPVAYLGDAQGLTSKEHAVYSVVIDLLYVHGGEIRNDPKFISGWISDMGSSAVRKALTSLDANPRITIEISEAEISQNRAKTEAKTKQNLRETAQKHGKIGGEKSAELRRKANESNDVVVADPSTEIQPDKSRVDEISKRDTKASTKKPAKRKSQIPDNAVITDKQIEYATNNQISLQEAEAQFSKFKNDAIAKGKMFVNWDRAYLTWITSEYFRPILTDGGRTNGNGNNSFTSNSPEVEKDRLRRIIGAAARGTSESSWPEG